MSDPAERTGHTERPGRADRAPTREPRPMSAPEGGVEEMEEAVDESAARAEGKPDQARPDLGPEHGVDEIAEGFSVPFVHQISNEPPAPDYGEDEQDVDDPEKPPTAF